MKKNEKLTSKDAENGRYWWRQPGAAKCSRPQLKPGDRCPSCQIGELAFDGLFMLVCRRCQKIADSGGFT